MAKGLVYVVDDAGGEYAALKSYLQPQYELTTVVGARDININYDIDINNIENLDTLIKSFDIYILIGGYKLYYFVTNKRPPNKKLELAIDVDRLNALTREFTKAGVVVMAPFTTPAYLARLGLLAGVKATVYPITELIKILKENNAIYINASSVKDKNIITIKDIRKTSSKDLTQTLREGA
ncbi:MAG: DJ-1/PfpI family protein [Thermoproteus sp.]